MIQGTSAMDRPVDRKRVVTRRRAVVGGVVLVVLVAAGLAWPRVGRWLSAERSVDASRIRIARVERGDLLRDVSVQGRVIAAFSPTLFSPADGIVELRVRAGAEVATDQVLATVTSPELNSRLEQERSTLLTFEGDLGRERIAARQRDLSNRQRIDLAEVGLEAARRAMARAERSRADGILNDVEYETAQDDLRKAELELKHAREDAALASETMAFEIRARELQVERQRLIVRELERQVGELTIRAPVDGLVSRIDVEDRDAVEPGQPVVAVVDLSAFEIEVSIPENYADELGTGTPAAIRFDGRVFDGRLKSVAPEVEGGQVEGIVAFVETVPEGLRQNQRLSTRLILESKRDVLKLPRGPFLEDGGGRQVYRIEDDVAVLHPVEVGAVSVAEVEIVSGLREGDRVVISDTDRFEKADRVFLRR